MKKLLLLFVIFCGISNLKAQYFQTGQDPASLKWRQINTENFQLIYPDYYELQAQKLANVMEKVYDYGGNSLLHKPKKISIILHTQTVKSNGLVAWAPKRSEFYTTPHQGIYAQDWLEQLALHEFRHVVQIGKLNSEIPKIIKILLGEQGTALVFGVYLPWWFIEGDAVVTETALSNFGRGRFPSFLMEHKAQVVEKGVYKYDKAYNGSFKDFVPDHYKLGYYVVGSAREKYGAELWNSVLNRVGKKPFSLNPFNKALKINTGFNKVGLYESVFDSLQKVWNLEDKNYITSKFKNISLENKIFSNYTYNHWLNDSTIITYKTALNEVHSFVKLDLEGKEHKLYRPGIIFNESVNFRDEWVCWAEQVPNLRWQHSGESLIRLFNVENSIIMELTPEFKAFAPSISPQKDRVVVVESDFSSNYFLSVYQISNGELLHRIQTENNNFFFSPEWLNEKEIVAIVLFNEGKQLAKFNVETGKMEVLIDMDLGELKNLKVVNSDVYFISSYSGKNGLYKFSLEDNSILQIYEPRFGVESPAISPNGENLILSDYTANGFRLIEIPLDERNQKKISEVKKANYVLANKLSAQESGVLDFTDSTTATYDSEKYSKTAHLFNFHSWAPAFVNPIGYEMSPGVSFMSQNKLGTAFTTLGYQWDLTEKTGKFYGKYTFKGWYPILDFELSSGKSASEYFLIQQTENKQGQVVQQDTSLERFTWNDTNVGFNMRIPLNLSRGKFSRLLQPEIKYNFTFYSDDHSTPENFYDGNFQSISYRLYFQQLLRQSSQDVYPNFGFIADGNYRHSPTGNTDFGSLALIQTIFYLPGILANHGVKLYSGIQKKSSSGVNSFNEAIRYPRGWGKRNTTQMFSFAFDYKMPLFYPEWSLGGLAYLQRVNASLFADYAYLEGNIYKDHQIEETFTSRISSFGIELTGDANFLQFYAPVEIGVRASYLPEMKNVFFDFLFSIDFNSL